MRHLLLTQSCDYINTYILGSKIAVKGLEQRFCKSDAIALLFGDPRDDRLRLGAARPHRGRLNDSVSWLAGALLLYRACAILRAERLGIIFTKSATRVT